jgi:hypothetical protein
MKSRFTALLTAVFVTAFGAWFVLLWGSAVRDVALLAALAGAGGATLFVGAIVLRRIERAHASALDREAKGLPLRDGTLEASSGNGANAKNRREPDGTAALETVFVDGKETPDLASVEAYEWIVPPDAQVAAVGTWSAARSGLLSARGLDAKDVRLIPVAILLNVPAIGLALHRFVNG